MVIDGQETDNPTYIANSFNNYFINVAKSLVQKIPTTSGSYANYLGPPCDDTLLFNPVSETELLGKIQQLNNSAPGYDNFAPSVINSAAPVIMPVLLHLCNSSLQSGIFPDRLKIAKVVIKFIVRNKWSFYHINLFIVNAVFDWS